MLEILILGTAAGGGFPQWNCACENCRLVRAGSLAPRLQSSVAVSGDGQTWHVVNASPDVGRQIERFLWPRLATSPSVRHSPIGRIFLTNADLDHTLGLFHLREGGRGDVTAPDAVRASLEHGLSLSRVLEAYGGITWQSAAAEWRPVDDTGLEVRAVPLKSHAPRYDASPAEGCHAIGLLFRSGGRSVGIFPDVAELSASSLAALESCERVWFDGTFWSEDEMLSLSGRTASAMDHLSIGGESGSLRQLEPVGLDRVAYLHINNTNPILRPDSAERAALERTGARVAEDGDHFVF